MVRAAALIALLISGCAQKANQNDAALQVAELKNENISLQARVAELEKEQAAMRKWLEATNNLARETYDAHESLRRTFNRNVAITNSSQDRIDSQLGNCGTEYVPGPNGYVLANRRCGPPAKK